MKRQSIDLRILPFFILALGLTLFIGFKGANVYREAEAYSETLSQKYGVTDLISARDNKAKTSLWEGEPKGPYVYTGYVGIGMNSTHAKEVHVLATGEEAREVYDTIHSYDRAFDTWLTLGVLAFFFTAVSAFMILAGKTDDESHDTNNAAPSNE